MRKTPLYLHILFFLPVTGLFLPFISTSCSLSSERFAFRDTAGISRIEILAADTLVLEKQNGGNWIVNENLPAGKIQVDNLLFCLNRLEIKTKIHPDHEGIGMRITAAGKTSGFRVGEWNGNSWIGKEGSKQRFITAIRGFPSLNLYDHVIPDLESWRDRVLFNLKSEEIREVRVIHTGIPSGDFVLKQDENNKTLIFEADGITALVDSITDPEKPFYYLSYFTGVYYDRMVNEGVQEFQDPKWIVYIKDTSGKEYRLRIIPVMREGKEDMFRAYVSFNDEPGYRETRYMFLDLILQDKQYFLKD